MMYVILLSYHIFSFFISKFFENFKFRRNFSKFTAGMGCRLIAVSVKIAGNRRLPIGKENTGVEAWLPSLIRLCGSCCNACFDEVCVMGSARDPGSD